MHTPCARTPTASVRRGVDAAAVFGPLLPDVSQTARLGARPTLCLSPTAPSVSWCNRCMEHINTEAGHQPHNAQRGSNLSRRFQRLLLFQLRYSRSRLQALVLPRAQLGCESRLDSTFECREPRDTRPYKRKRKRTCVFHSSTLLALSCKAVFNRALLFFSVYIHT